MTSSAGVRRLGDTPDCVLATADEEEWDGRPSKQFKDREAAMAGAESPAKPRWTFKAVGNAIIATKRLQAALNPTYTFGKRPDQPKVKTPTLSRNASLEDAASVEREEKSDRGNKARLLFRSLSTEGAPPPPPGASVKGIANVLLAMKRFQASLNPTYTAGKQHDKVESGPRHKRTPTPTKLPSVVDDAHSSFTGHGHKASILFAPLPDARS